MTQFAERGFAAARMSVIAEQAGVSKAAIYRYFPDKEALFRAVVERRGLDLAALRGVAAGSEHPLTLIAALLRHMAGAMERPELRQLALMVIGEARSFPELTRVWREQVIEPALGLLSGLIAQGQASGTIRAGEPRLLAFSVAGPLLMGAIWRQVVEPAGGTPLSLADLAAEHAVTIARGLATEAPRGGSA